MVGLVIIQPPLGELHFDHFVDWVVRLAVVVAAVLVVELFILFI